MKPLEENGMPPSEVTVAEVLKSAGYQTAHIGKWHLGGIGDMRPEKQGFDDSLYLSGISYLPADSPDVVNAKQDFDPIDKMVWASTRYSTQFNGSHPFAPKGYITDYYTDEAVKVIEANRNRPFFLYLAHWGIHNPLQAKKEDYDALSHIQDHRLRVYAAMITALDRGVGRVLDALQANGIADNTLVIFTSDNGGAGYLGLPDINKPYRGWKLTLFEGGTHVPFFARWPGHIAPGTRYDKPVEHIDILPTVAAAGGAKLPDDRIIDGVDVLPFVRGERTDVPHETLFWREGYHQAVLHDGWKLIVSGVPDRKWLFHLTDNPTEHQDLAAQHPEIVAQLQALLDAHNAEQAAPMWPSVIESPQLIDKTGAEAYVRRRRLRVLAELIECFDGLHGATRIDRRDPLRRTRRHRNHCDQPSGQEEHADRRSGARHRRRHRPRCAFQTSRSDRAARCRRYVHGGIRPHESRSLGPAVRRARHRQPRRRVGSGEGLSVHGQQRASLHAHMGMP